MQVSYYESAECTVYHGDCTELMPRMVCDHLFADPPYSERTHSGHDASGEIADRTKLKFDAWNEDMVSRFVAAQRISVPGWRVVFSDHVLQRNWETALSKSGLYVFSPVPYVVPGGRVRFSGDGPASWATWITAARPKESRFSGWGSLPGAYVLPKGCRDPDKIVGGKELWIMTRLVADYSRAGETVMDPVCGAGTTLIAAMLSGRKSIGIDNLEEMCEMTAKRIEQLRFDGFEVNI